MCRCAGLGYHRLIGGGNGEWDATYHDDKFDGRGYGGTLVIASRRDAR